MYVNPFWLGVGATIATEALVIVAYGIILSVKKGGKK